MELARDYVEVSLPELARSADSTYLLRTSSESNLQGLLLDLGSHRADTQPPEEALLYVDEAVARQVPLAAVLRGYQLALEHWLRWCAAAVARHADPADHAGELQHAIAVAVRYVDRLSDLTIIEFERELQRRATSGYAHRAALINALLKGEAVDVEESSDLLRYPLQGRHVALALRIRPCVTNEVEILQAEARACAASLGATELLTFATGLNTLDAWVAVRQTGHGMVRPSNERVNIGVGTPLSGVGGFAQSHREAQRALRIFDVTTPGRRNSVTYYDRVRLLWLMAQNTAELRTFVTATLGSLACNDERSRELRETLFAFFEANKSYTAVARSSHLHKNTVIQRVTRASRLTARHTANDLDIHVALMAVDAFGDDMLADT
ncbi:PucR family transcriptional regulator [Nocardia aobensis]|uniref:PucR family transcriptional regulator n=1 Tax=Nocardia aobensis TaxID=257277 RepID=A0ABW6PEG6_9NOCA